ncbi:MAG: hypothetical protein ACI35M_02335 [Alistipes sp.]
MQKIIPTILLTSLFWIVVYILVLYKPDNQSACEEVADYSEAIIGQWKPIEESEIELTFSKYGTMRMDDVPIDLNYTVEKNVVTLVFGTIESSFEINIYDSGNDTYLELFDAAHLTGTYKKNTT